jgi:alcohol dehydrogenase YqhD (iron-dependent ADH family)
MTNFSFSYGTKILFGKGAEAQVGKETAVFSRRVLLHYGQGSIAADPGNYVYRAQIMWAGTIGHNDFLSLGRMGDWGSHMIEHEQSALYVRVFGLPMDFEHPEGTALPSSTQRTCWPSTGWRPKAPVEAEAGCQP